MQKILLVNNDFDTMSLLKEWLEKKSYQVMYTANPDEVPELIHEFNPGLVLVDIVQKEVIKRIKNDNRTAQLPVILMSGVTSRQEPEEAFVDDVIDKVRLPKHPDLCSTVGALSSAT